MVWLECFLLNFRIKQLNPQSIALSFGFCYFGVSWGFFETGPHCMAQAGLTPLILLPLTPMYWDT
jgi:hypothetical protein